MVDCYEHVIQSTESVRGLIGESSATSFQLNERQCGILAEELVETCTFLEKRNVGSEFVEGVGCISLQHLCSAVNRAEVLVKKCCCRDLESWLVASLMLVEIQEEFLAIILDIHLWRTFLDFAITCGRSLSRQEKSESMKIMDEEYHELSKNMRRESHGLQRAAVEDKKTIILRTASIADLRGSSNGLDHLRATFIQSWLRGSDACRVMDLKKYEYVAVLGTGGCGTVLKVKWLGVECALKVLLGQDEKEATALKGLFHPNIIRLFHYWEDRPEDPQSHLLMELMPKDLGAYMRERMKTMASSKLQMGKGSGPFSLPVAIDIMYQIAQAMRYMNEKRLTHRDLKPANILVKERPKVGLPCIDGAGYLDVKLADFGLVKSFKNTSTFQAHSRNKGTGLYRAPEVFGKDMALKRNYLPLADVWSFGITCAEILSGKEAYAEYVHKYGLAIQSMVFKEGLRPTLPKDCPPYLTFCIKSCWEFLPTRRPTFSSICKLLRHAKLLSLGVTKLDDSKSFFAYSTRSEQVKSLNLASPSRVRASTFFQSSLKFMGIGPRPVPNVAEVMPATAILHEVRLVPPPLITEDGLELDAKISEAEEEGAVVSLGNRQEKHSEQNSKKPGGPFSNHPVLQTRPLKYRAISLREDSYPIQPAIMPRKKLGTEMLTTEADGRKLAKISEAEEEGAVVSLGNRQEKHSEQNSKKPGGPFSNHPVLQTRPLKYRAISLREDSYPIQPAIMPRKKLGTEMLTTEADGGKLAKISEAEEEGAVVSLGNRQEKHSEQNSKKPGGPFSNHPVLQTRPLKYRAISLREDSYPIQPAIMPRKKLGTEMLTTEADGGKLAKISEAEEEGAVVSLGNRQEKHSEQNSKKPGGPFSNHPVLQTRPLKYRAISLREDSYPIQPAIMPRKKLGTEMLTTEADGGKLAKISEAEEEGAVVSLGNRQEKHSEQNSKKPGGPFSNHPVLQTRPLKYRAISLREDSYPIQPAIMPRKKLGTEMLTTEADGGKLAKISEAEEEGAVVSLGNRQEKHSEQNSKKPGGPFSNHPVLQTRPLKYRAISLREDSYPIQPAIMPRKKLGTEMLTTEADGRKLAKISEAEEDAVSPLGNRQGTHFR